MKTILLSHNDDLRGHRATAIKLLWRLEDGNRFCFGAGCSRSDLVGYPAIYTGVEPAQKNVSPGFQYY